MARFKAFSILHRNYKGKVLKQNIVWSSSITLPVAIEDLEEFQWIFEYPSDIHSSFNAG